VELHANIFLWYGRLDILVGLIRCTEVSLRREWYVCREDYDARQVAHDPDDLAKQPALGRVHESPPLGYGDGIDISKNVTGCDFNESCQ
jgi:hypothetical protein